MARQRNMGLSTYLFGAAAVGSVMLTSLADAAPRGVTLRHDLFPEPTPMAKDAGGGSGGSNSCQFTYYGGSVISNVHVVPVYWGAVDSNVTAWAPGYLATLANSTYLDQLSEYSTVGKTGSTSGGGTGGTTGQTITRGDAVAGITITPSDTSTTIDDTAIGPELTTQIQNGVLPAPEYDAQGYPNTLYYIFFPTGITITLQGNSSCSYFCGYHNSGTYAAPPSQPNGNYIPYAVIPYMGTGSSCASGCSWEPSTSPETEIMTGTVSHELSEAITDTSQNLAWYNQTSCTITNPTGMTGGPKGQDPGEIADVCATAGSDNDTPTVPGTSVEAQWIWSNVQNTCTVTNPSIGDQPDPVDGGSVTPPPSTDAGGTSTPDSGGGGTSTPDSGGGGTPPPSTDAGGTSTPDSGTTPPPWNPDSGVGGNTTDGGGGGTGGDGDEPGSPTGKPSGSGCTMASGSSSSGFGLGGALLGLALLGASRRKRSS